MKFLMKSAAAAMSLALMSISAHAQLAPPTPATAAPGNTGLFLAVYDAAGVNSDLVNLNYLYSGLTVASGNLAPNSATSAFSVTANPTGALGSVLQVNFGVVPGFTSLFGSPGPNSLDNYMVVAVNPGGAGTEGIETTSSTTPTTAYLGVGTFITNVDTEIASWSGAQPPPAPFITDTTGSATYNANNSSGLNDGQVLAGQQFGGAVGTALGFYNITTTSSHTDAITAYANASGNGFWYLSTLGDLSYNVPFGVVGAVPLPAAVWLLGSGLLGLAGIGRRRRAAA